VQDDYGLRSCEGNEFKGEFLSRTVLIEKMKSYEAAYQ